MKQNTIELIKKLQDMTWFTHVGEPIDEDVAPAGSWKEAIKIANSRFASNVAMESQNLLTERLCFEFPERYHGVWNTIGAQIKPVIDQIIESKIKDVVQLDKLGRGLKDAVVLDIRAACMEQEYADLIPPRFFAERVKWYLAGHFPCGWEGDFPEGRLIVF